MKWFVGEDLFSSWMYETREEQSREQKRLGFHSFVQVEPLYPPAERLADAEGHSSDICELRADEGDELDNVTPQNRSKSQH